VTLRDVKSSRCFRFCVVARMNETLTTYLPSQAPHVLQLGTSAQSSANTTISVASVTDAVNVDNVINHAGWDVSSSNSAEVRGSRSS
jgi:hypothetical protein